MKLLFRKFKNVFILSQRQRKLIFLVFWLSIYRNILLLCGSKKAFTEHILQNQKVKAVLTDGKIAIAKDITMAIHIVNNYLPWKNVCRHQSWQAVSLLLKYQIPFDYFVGIDKTKSIKEGHSWVKVNGRFICGRCNVKEYSVFFKV
ncbi:lasso peptide biosynthesis B2 protein [Flavobacterium commune]|uniref:Microcin J25-processing protein McjB C-terminal domain-containing protein n=1 Tax=Flavobacterium commune TaxID=1306519 RepID=A0A1D9P982_9FLAO|nr:lasso peptide biosynthesis B2 protein [Flavobacterium commune]AOZ99139.1 hypothetical protein BIW12_06630 [Flavobacterium commune]